MALQTKRTIRERTRANERKVTSLIEEATEDPANVVFAAGVCVSVSQRSMAPAAEGNHDYGSIP